MMYLSFKLNKYGGKIEFYNTYLTEKGLGHVRGEVCESFGTCGEGGITVGKVGPVVVGQGPWGW